MKNIPYSKEQLMRANMKLMEQNKRYKRALEEISNADWNSEGLNAERELDKITDIAFKALEGSE